MWKHATGAWLKPISLQVIGVQMEVSRWDTFHTQTQSSTLQEPWNQFLGPMNSLCLLIIIIFIILSTCLTSTLQLWILPWKHSAGANADAKD